MEEGERKEKGKKGEKRERTHVGVGGAGVTNEICGSTVGGLGGSYAPIFIIT